MRQFHIMINANKHYDGVSGGREGTAPYQTIDKGFSEKTILDLGPECTGIGPRAIREPCS